MNYRTDTDFHYDLVELLAKRLRPTLYVELGIAAAKCIRRVAPYCQQAIGVDLVAPHTTEGYEFFGGTTVEFANSRLPTLGAIELALIDADHRHESSLRDFEFLLPHVAEDGLILLHDTYPENRSWLADELCSDSYRTADLIYRRAVEYGVEIVTLPTPPGLSIVRKRSRPLIWLDRE